MIRTALSIAVLSAVMVSAANAQQYVYPAKGQSPQQQQATTSQGQIAYANARGACLSGRGYTVK
jgi:hypothetical protein